jgi:hypothetical protein
MKRIEDRPWKEIVDVRTMKKARAKLGEFSELLHELDDLLARLVVILEEERAAAKSSTPKTRG